MEIVAHLHHAAEHLADGVRLHRQQPGTVRKLPVGSNTVHRYTRLRQLAAETVGEVILAIDKQRREHRILVVPAPAFPQPVAVLEGEVGIEIALYTRDAMIAYDTCHLRQVRGREHRIHTAHAIEVAMQNECGIVHFASAVNTCPEIVIGSEPVQGRNGSDTFHRGGRAQMEAFTELIDRYVIGQIPNHHTRLDCLQQRAAEYAVQPHDGILLPAEQAVRREGRDNTVRIFFLADGIIVLRLYCKSLRDDGVRNHRAV